MPDVTVRGTSGANPSRITCRATGADATGLLKSGAPLQVTDDLADADFVPMHVEAAPHCCAAAAVQPRSKGLKLPAVKKRWPVRRRVLDWPAMPGFSGIADATPSQEQSPRSTANNLRRPLRLRWRIILKQNGRQHPGFIQPPADGVARENPLEPALCERIIGEIGAVCMKADQGRNQSNIGQ